MYYCGLTSHDKMKAPRIVGTADTSVDVSKLYNIKLAYAHLGICKHTYLHKGLSFQPTRLAVCRST